MTVGGGDDVIIRDVIGDIELDVISGTPRVDLDLLPEAGTSFEILVGGEPGRAGPTGPTGSPGAPGAVGPTGATGSQGLPGDQGPTGPRGLLGPPGPTGATGAASTVVGPTGAQGPTGPRGPTGPAGTAGSSGPTGASGTPGIPGATGPTGPQGPQSIVTFIQPDIPISQAKGDIWFDSNDQNRMYVAASVDADEIAPGEWEEVPGTPGVPGPPGEDGQPMFTWIRYADTPTSGMSDLPTGKAYLGIAYNKPDPTESSVYGDYQWSLIQGPEGEAGDPGVPGPPGPDGQPTFTWIKYGTSSAGAGLSDDPTGKTYLGIAYNKATSVESTNPADYEWSLIQGAQGSQGIAGPPGADGATLYTWLKYADTPTTGMSDLPAGKTYMGIAYNKTSSTESSTYADYAWSLIQGPEGDQGVEGPPGADGQPTYVWIKYADSVAGAGISDSPAGKTYIGFAYNKATPAESSTPGDYEWSLIQGPQGPAGTNAPAISLSATTQILAVPAGGGASTPTTSTVTGVAVNTTITAWTYSVDGAAFSSSVPAGVSRASNVVTITGATMTARTIAVKMADAAGIADTLTVAKVSDGATGGTGPPGADAYTVLLTNESHVFPGSETAALAGAIASQVIAYKGATQVPATIGAITGIVTGMTTALGNNGTTTAAFSVTVTTALVAQNGTLTVPITVDGHSFTKTFSWTVSRTGATGSQGIQGPPGPNGQQLYTWIKYADTPTTGMSDSPTGKAYLGIAYNKTTATESSVYADYEWSLTQGATGGQGVPGPAGSDGQPTYTWIKYGTSAAGAGLSDDPTGKTHMGIAYNKTTATESSTPGDYEWSLIQGPQGPSGANAATITLTSTTQSLISPAGGGVTTPTTATVTGTAVNTTITAWDYSVDGAAFSTSVPAGVGRVNNVVTITGSTMTASTIAVRMGNGAGVADTLTVARIFQGAGVSGTAVTYQVHTNGTTAPTGTWQASPQATSPGQFLWTRTITSYTDATSSTAYSVAAHGTSGATGTAGVGVSGTVVTYQVHSNGTTAPTGTWVATPQATTTGQFLWTRTITTYTDASNSTAYSVAAHGSTGSTGAAGADAYTVLLSNEAQTFAAGTTNAQAATATSTVIAYKGTVQQTATVGTITGGATGISAAVTNNGTTAPLITFTVTTALATANGTFAIPVTVGGITFNQVFSWSLAFSGAAGSAGTPAPSIDLTSTTQILTAPAGGGVTNPTTAVVTGTARNTTITVWDYSVDGGAFSTSVPAGVSRSTNVVTITGATMTARTIAVRMADAGGTADTLTVARSLDGATGGTGTPGADAYTVLLTNENHTFPGSTTTAVAGSTTSQVIAYKAAVLQTATIGTITGQVTGLTTALTNNGTTTAGFTVTVTTALVTQGGTLTVPITVDGKAFTKTFAWTVSWTGATGSPGPAAAIITLISTTQALVSPSGGGATTPTTATVTGSAVNTTIDKWDYSVDSAAFSATVPGGVSRTGNVVTITGSTMTAATIAVKMSNTASGVTDTLTVAKVLNGAAGADAYTLILSNEAHTFAGSATAALAGSTTSQVIAYKGATLFAATIGTITGQVTGLTTALTNNGTTTAGITITVTTALVTQSGTLTVPVTVDGKGFTKTIAWAVSRTGATGPAGDPGPVAPPSGSPVLTAVGSVNSITLLAEGIVDPTTILDYYMNDILVTSTRSTVYVVRTAIGGGALDADVVYSFRVVARNTLGSAATSATVTGQLNLAIDTETILATVAAGFVLAGEIQVGNISIHPDTGITIPLASGGEIQFPADGSPAIIDAILRTSDLSVSGGLTINGISNYVNGKVFLASGVGNPQTLLDINDYRWRTVRRFPLVTAAGTSGVSGLARTTDNTTWGTIIHLPSGSEKLFVTINDATGAVIGSRHSDDAVLDFRAVTAIGDRFYVLGHRYNSGKGDSEFLIHVYDKNAAQVGVGEFPTNMSGNRIVPLDYWDGAIARDPATSSVWFAFTQDNGRIRYRRYSVNISTGAVTPTPIQEVVSDAVGQQLVRSMYVGTADFGPTRYVFGGYGTVNDFFVQSFDSLGTYVPADSWGTTAYPTGIYWDATTSRFQVPSRDATSFFIAEYSGTKVNQTVYAQYTWYDTNIVDGNKESAPSPINNRVIPARAFATLAVPAPPKSGTGDNDPNAVNVYTDIDATTRLTTTVIGGAATTFYVVNTVGTATHPGTAAVGPAPPVSSTFPASSATGEFASASGVDYFRGTGAFNFGGIRGTGDGRTTVPDATKISGFQPIGSMIMYAGTTEPAGWLICDGRSLSRTTYAALYAVIGTAFGSVDGSSFSLPDTRRRFPWGADPIGGALAVGFTDPQATVASRNPSHTHVIDGQTGGASWNTPNTGTNTVPRLGAFDGHSHGGVTGAGASPGTSTGHPNIAVAFIIRYL